MKNILFKFILLTIILLSISGCASHMPAKHYTKIMPENNDSKLIIVNTTSLLLYPTTNSINAAIDGRKIGNIDRKEFTEIPVTKGKHELLLEHWDLKFWPTTHEITIDKDITIIEVFSSWVSTKFSYSEMTEEEVQNKFSKKQAN